MVQDWEIYLTGKQLLNLSLDIREEIEAEDGFQNGKKESETSM